MELIWIQNSSYLFSISGIKNQITVGIIPYINTFQNPMKSIRFAIFDCGPCRICMPIRLD